MNNENQQPLSIQGDVNEREELLGGTTNLSLDQLKNEGGTTNFSEDESEVESGDGNTDRYSAIDDYDQLKDDIAETDVDDEDGDPIDDWDKDENE